MFKNLNGDKIKLKVWIKLAGKQRTEGDVSHRFYTLTEDVPYYDFNLRHNA